MLRTHCCRHKCFPVYPRAQHLLQIQILCPGHKNVSDFVQKHFVSATNVSQFARARKRHEQQCFRNNVSSFASSFKQSCTYRTVLGKFAVVNARTRFFNIFKFLKSRNRKCASFSSLGNLITRLHLKFLSTLRKKLLVYYQPLECGGCKVVHKLRCFYWFSEVLEGILDVNG